MKIKDFKLDRDKGIIELKDNLIEFINKLISDKKLNKLLNQFALANNLSSRSLQLETKQFLFKNFVNREGKFNRKFNLISIIKYSFIFILFMIFSVCFSRKKKIQQKSFDLIVDNNTEYSNIKKFEILNDKANLVFITNKKNKDKNFFSYVFNYKNCLIENKIFFFKTNLKFFFNFFVVSINSKNNLIPILYHLLKINLKYKTIFNDINSKYLIQERFYDTSALRDEIFHKNGGIYTSCIQKNLFQLNGPGMFVHTDILFTLGKKSADNAEDMGCKIRKKIPVGSWNYERSLKRHHQKHNKKIYDLVVFASDHTADFHSGYNSYYLEYYEHLNWIKKFAENHKNLSICIKHKKNFTDKKELDILFNVKNIDYVVDFDEDHSDSYIIGENAKSLCTWSSTLGYEMIGSGKICYFLDPNNSNHSFLAKNQINELVRLIKYEDFEKKILKTINGDLNMQIISRKEDYCLSSQNVSQKILNFFNI